MENSSDRIWLSWEDHRRSRVLAKEFCAQYIPVLSRNKSVTKYFMLSVRTIFILIKKRPNVVFCQNPSIFLNTLLCLIKPFFRFRLISDRHTNFKFKYASSYRPKWVLFRVLSNFTIRYSDLVIVTNNFLKKFVECNGGDAVVLPDKIPTFDVSNCNKSKSVETSALFVCTFSDDEPVIQVVEAFKAFEGRVKLLVTGDTKKSGIDLSIIKGKNIEFLGFVSEYDYMCHMNSVDFVVVLTDMEYTLNCGSYEAVSLAKPMILGRTNTIQNYFYQGAVYTNSDTEEIIDAVDNMIMNFDELKNKVILLKDDLINNWQDSYEIVEKKICKLCDNDRAL